MRRVDPLHIVSAVVAAVGIAAAGRLVFPRDPVAWLVGLVAYAAALQEFAYHAAQPLTLPTNAVVVGGGLMGAAFGTITGLPKAKWVLVAIAVSFIDPVTLLATCGLGLAVIPAAVVRTVGSERRNLVALATGVPIVLATLAMSL